MTSVPRTNVRSHLIRGGVSLKPSTHAPAGGDERHSGQVRWNSPYGFQYNKGKLVPHPQEFETLRLILDQFNEASTYEEVAAKLNTKKLRPRSAKQWTRFTVRQIVKWHHAHPKVF